jgi:hypothetical protein
MPDSPDSDRSARLCADYVIGALMALIEDPATPAATRFNALKLLGARLNLWAPVRDEQSEERKIVVEYLTPDGEPYSAQLRADGGITRPDPVQGAGLWPAMGQDHAGHHPRRGDAD